MYHAAHNEVASRNTAKNALQEPNDVLPGSNVLDQSINYHIFIRLYNSDQLRVRRHVRTNNFSSFKPILMSENIQDVNLKHLFQCNSAK